MIVIKGKGYQSINAYEQCIFFKVGNSKSCTVQVPESKNSS